MTFADLRQKLKSGEVSSRELVQEKINRIKELDPTLNSFLTLNADQALRNAEQIDKQIASGDSIPTLSGIPLAIKDSSPTKSPGLLRRIINCPSDVTKREPSKRTIMGQKAKKVSPKATFFKRIRINR